MGPVRINEEIAQAIYAILMEECGAPEVYRDNFIHAFGKQNRQPTEWRFCGTLGFGGKFWQNAGKWYVNAYAEDLTPVREKAMEAANRRLNELARAYAGDCGGELKQQERA